VRSSVDNASVDGIVRELRKRYDDHFSHYLDPHQLQEFESATSGRFSGVGLTVTGVGRGLRVASVLPRTPAQRARIKEGDLITAVDGRSLAGVPADVATARIKGPPGTTVELRVVSGSGGGARNVKLKRASVAVPVAVGEIKRAGASKVAYVPYATFSEGARRVSSTIQRLDRRGAGTGARSAGKRRGTAQRGRAVSEVSSSPRASWSSRRTAAPWAITTTRPSAIR
jgi:carboxyl-terminal processing protease